MAIALSDVQTQLQAAVTALAAGDCAAAELCALSAQTLLAGIPDSTFGGTPGSQLRFRETIEQVLMNIRRRRAAAAFPGPYVQVPVVYARPDS